MKIEHITLNIDGQIIEFFVGYDDEGWLYMNNDYLGVYVCGLTVEECLGGIEAELRDLYNAYAKCPDEKLDKNAQRLKQALKKIFPNGLKEKK